MKKNYPYENLKPWLILKEKEFKLMGYEGISFHEIWLYLVNDKWKNDTKIAFHKQVSDLSSLQPNEYFSFALLQRQKYADKDVDLNDIDDLF